MGVYYTENLLKLLSFYTAMLGVYCTESLLTVFAFFYPKRNDDAKIGANRGCPTFLTDVYIRSMD